MDVKKLIQASMLCALFVVLSVMSLTLGFSYFGYIDFVVPIFIGIIYLECGFRYSLLSSISSLILIIFVLGNVSYGIMMIQSMILGILVAIIIDKSKRNIFDDLLFASILGCIVMIIMDINFSSLIGTSLLKESKESVDEAIRILNAPEEVQAYKDVLFYMSISILPLGTGIITYVGTLLVSKRFKVLKNNNIKKWYIIRKYKEFAPLIMISKNTLLAGSAYAIIFYLLNMMHIFDNFTYLKILLNCINCIVLFFIVQDSYLIVNRVIFSLTKSHGKMLLSQFFIFICLVNAFNITAIILIISNLFFDKKFNIKLNNEKIIEEIIIN